MNLFKSNNRVDINASIDVCNRSKNDINFFSKNMLSTNPLLDVQLDCLSLISNNKFTSIQWPRRVGSSYMLTVKMLHSLLFVDGNKDLFMANSSTGSYHRDAINILYNSIQQDYKDILPKLYQDKHLIRSSNGNRIYFSNEKNVHEKYSTVYIDGGPGVTTCDNCIYIDKVVCIGQLETNDPYKVAVSRITQHKERTPPVNVLELTYEIGKCTGTKNITFNLEKKEISIRKIGVLDGNRLSFKSFYIKNKDIRYSDELIRCYDPCVIVNGTSFELSNGWSFDSEESRSNMGNACAYDDFTLNSLYYSLYSHTMTE